MRKVATITLAYYASSSEYAILKVTDSLEHKPGSYLKESAVKQLVDSNSWKVTILPANKV